MTLIPKGKAVELVERYKQINLKYVLNGEANEGDINDEAKECAILAVDEILLDKQVGYSKDIIEEKKYWKQVKQEIQLL